MKPYLSVTTEFAPPPRYAGRGEIAITIPVGDRLVLLSGLSDGEVSFYSLENSSLHAMPISELRNFVDEKELMVAMLRL